MPSGWDQDFKMPLDSTVGLSLQSGLNDCGNDLAEHYDQGLTDKQWRGANCGPGTNIQFDATGRYVHELELTDEQRRGINSALARRRNTAGPIEEHGDLVARQGHDARLESSSPEKEDCFNERNIISPRPVEPTPILEKQLAGRACDQFSPCGTCQSGGNGCECAYTGQVSGNAQKRQLVEDLDEQPGETPTRLRARKRSRVLHLETAARQKSHSLGYNEPVNIMIYELRTALNESST